MELTKTLEIKSITHKMSTVQIRWPKGYLRESGTLERRWRNNREIWNQLLQNADTLFAIVSGRDVARGWQRNGEKRSGRDPAHVSSPGHYHWLAFLSRGYEKYLCKHL